jgi:hypothetical protein
MDYEKPISDIWIQRISNNFSTLPKLLQDGMWLHRCAFEFDHFGNLNHELCLDPTKLANNDGFASEMLHTLLSLSMGV